MTAAVHQNMNVPKFLAHPKDPPGQKTLYIYPGDNRNQTYRLSTFKNFPYEVDAYQLAKNGFYFTGYKDRVKCFSCGMAVENWNEVITPELAQWHNKNCSFLQQIANNHAFKNMHIHSRVQAVPSNTINQSRTPSPPPARNSVPTAGEVLMSGVGGGISSLIFQTNQTLPTNSFHNILQDEPNHGSNVEGRMALFPCLNSVNTHMRNREIRLQTFADRAENWPAHRINATPQQIADAGFFYLGERDRVKCWYCNGGLQNWEREDDAWEEHAKWFPMCEFVLQQKGPQYVHGIVSRHPNLQRPPLYNPAENVSFNLHNLVTRNLTTSPSFGSPQNQAPVIIDPRKKQEEQRRKIAEEMKSSEMVANAKLLGFEEKNIIIALERQYQQHEVMFPTFEKMVEGMMAVDEDEDENQATKTDKQTKQSCKKNEFEKLMEEKKCRNCQVDDSSMVFIPCGHLVCCLKCGQSAKNCPVCKSIISERIRSYLS